MLGEINPFRYRGYVFDQETQLYYLRSRYYDAVSSRFVSVNSLTYESKNDKSTYCYCSNNPINRVDKDGLIDFADFDDIPDDLINDIYGTGLGGGLKAHNPYGRLGGPIHMFFVKRAQDLLEESGLDSKGESKVVVTNENGASITRYADVSAGPTDNPSYYIQVGKITKSGFPVARESAAIIDIMRMDKPVIFLAYNRPGYYLIYWP